MTLKQPIFTHFCDKKERIVTDGLVYFVSVYLLIWLIGWLVDSFTLWDLFGSYQEGK